eukprot:s2015_g16.t2
MGDGHAVEIAQGSHHALLQIEAGCMRENESLEYRKPIPRGDFVELLAIDDHIGVQRIPIDEVGKDTPHRDTVVFSKAQQAYEKVGLVVHPGKAKRRETSGVILGADFDGLKGRVCAPRMRILLLMSLMPDVFLTPLVCTVDCQLQVEPPSKAVPRWLEELGAGHHDLFDLVCQSASYPRIIGRWVRLLLLLAGDVERNPGPSQARKPRGELDLGVGFCKATADRMSKCLDAFAHWIGTELQMDFDRVMADHQSCALALRGYGMALYRKGFPRYLYVYAVTAVQDQYPQHRPFLGGAWQIDRKWQVAEPGRCRPVLSLAMFRAALCLALLWNWPRWAAVTMIAFAGMLHPAEFISLERRDLMLPRDTDFTITVLYIHLRNPKTSRFARQQHVKISDPDIISFVDSMFGLAPLNFKLFGGTISMYRNQWNAVMERLGIPYKQIHHGITPGSLRGSGATSLYLLSENIPLICWRGRWSRVRTLEFYLQEVAAQWFRIQELQLHQSEVTQNDRKSIQKIIELLGGHWGQIALEQKYEFAERALYRCQQKSDESADSYLARADIMWTELINKSLKISDLQAAEVRRECRLLSGSS